MNILALTHAQPEPTLPRRPLRFVLLQSVLEGLSPLSAGLEIGYRFGFDSGLMLDYVCRNNAEGAGPVGRRIDRWFLNRFGWPAVRERKHRLQETLRDLIRLHRPAEQGTHLVDLGGAPARYLIELLGEIGHAGVSATVLDPDPVSLGEGRRLAEVLGRDRIDFVRADPLDFGGTPTLARDPDIVTAAGLLDRMDADAEVRRLLNGVRDLLVPGGQFVFTAQCGDRDRAKISAVLRSHHGSPLFARSRELSVVEGWARAAGFDGIRSETGPDGVHAVCVATRC